MMTRDELSDNLVDRESRGGSDANPIEPIECVDLEQTRLVRFYGGVMMTFAAVATPRCHRKFCETWLQGGRGLIGCG